MFSIGMMAMRVAVAAAAAAAMVMVAAAVAASFLMHTLHSTTALSITCSYLLCVGLGHLELSLARVFDVSGCGVCVCTAQGVGSVKRQRSGRNAT